MTSGNFHAVSHGRRVRFLRRYLPTGFRWAVLLPMLICSAWVASAMEEEKPGPLIERFSLNREKPVKEFSDHRLKIELVDIASNDVMRTITLKIFSRAHKAEYQNGFQKHTYIEMLKHYVGDPISGNPYKCPEGWLYYDKSDSREVSLSLYRSPGFSDSFWYDVHIAIMENWKYGVMALCWIGILTFIYYYFPFLAGFILIQHSARVHALRTGFPSMPIVVYLIKRLPVIAAFILLFYSFFSFDWWGVAFAAVLGIGLQCYLTWTNKQQLSFYATATQLTSIPESRGRAFEGRIQGFPVRLAVGGAFYPASFQGGDVDSGSTGFHMSYLVVEVKLNDDRWEGLLLERDLNKSSQWSANMPFGGSQAVQAALARISTLPKYSIARIDVRNGTLLAMKLFAPDSPAEIHLLVDLLIQVAAALNQTSQVHCAPPTETECYPV